MAFLTYLLETPLATNPDFPSGYTQDNYKQAFDFTRNWFYQPISDSTNGGIAVTDLSTMDVIQTPTLTQMYAGTSYGHPAGSPPSQSVFDVAAGKGTDLYMLMDNGLGVGVAGEFCRFTRVNPTTMKVTGEFYIDSAFPPPLHNVMGLWGVVNTTTSHTIVAYTSNAGLGQGPQIFDGTGMAPIGIGPTPLYGTSNNNLTIPGAKHGDGSCDFIMLNCDNGGLTGYIDIWRIKITNALVLTGAKTGTVHTAAIFTPGSNFYIAQADYDTTHDAIIMLITNSSVPTGPPVWLISVNWNGTINWWHGPYGDIGIPYSKGQSNLTGTTYMFGDSGDLKLVDTATGAITYTGSIAVAGSTAGSYYRVWDASRNAYWTYALSRGFVRIDFHGTPVTTLIDAELVFSDTPSFVDLAVAANRRKFISASGTPAWMENNAALAFAGQVPRAYLSVVGGLPNTFASNNGAGGPFAITFGPLTLAGGPGCTPYFITEAAGPAGKPQWRLSVSDDGSRTWSTLVKPRDIGATGQYKTRLRWLKMGHFRQRSIKLECTDPVRRNIIGIYLDDEQGMA